MIAPTTFEQLLEEGVARVQIGESHGKQVEALRKRARGWPDLVSRRIKEWHHVRRATFFEHPVGGLKMALLSAAVWVPEAVEFSTQLRDATNRYADEHDVPLLKTPFTNIGIHYMEGWPDDPARITEHLDVEAEKGYVATLSVEGADEGLLTLLACKNLCDNRGLEQVRHGTVAIEPRISYYLTNLQK